MVGIRLVRRNKLNYCFEMEAMVFRSLWVLQAFQILTAVCVDELSACVNTQLSNFLLSGCSDFSISQDGMGIGPFCQTLESANINGCFCRPGLGEWRTVGRANCNLDLFLPGSPFCSPKDYSLQRTTRKIMSKVSTNTAELNSIQKGAAVKEKRVSTFSVTAVQAVGAAGGIFLLSCVIICPCLRPRKKESNHRTLSQPPLPMDSVSSSEAITTGELEKASPHRSSPCRKPNVSGCIIFTMAQLNKATRNFSPSFKIGQGGFGAVYRGQLDDGRVVAVKRARKDTFEPRLTAEFNNEIEMLARIEHLNLVKLIGYFERDNERILVTEYVANGTLREHLDGQHGTALDLSTRLDIAIDVAHALTYLHLYADQQIIHRDVKSSNILLTENFRAKVADFGFSRVGPLEANETHVSTQVKGTAGYLDPEYLKTYQLTQKSDVYSFGILLIEILTGRRPIELKRATEERVTIRWAFKKSNEGRVTDVLDPQLVRCSETDMAAEKMFELAFQCSAPTKQDRPTMKQAQEQLWSIRKEYQNLKSRAKCDYN